MQQNYYKPEPDPRNAKEHFQSFIRKKTESVKQSETITYQLNPFKNPNIVDIKLQNFQKLYMNYPRL